VGIIFFNLPLTDSAIALAVQTFSINRALDAQRRREK
jgi:hypothetical protein